MARLVGYARVSHREQNEARQMVALRKEGIEESNIYLDKQSGKDFNRPQYRKMLQNLREGDAIFILSIDRLGRNYEEMIEQWNYITKEPKVDIVVLDIWDSAKLINDHDELSGMIQKLCCFNKKMADRLAAVVVKLYSSKHQAEWRDKKNEGLGQFLWKSHTFRWEGFSVWDAGNGTVDCFYDADIVLKPTKEVKSNKNLQEKLKKNPFISSDAIYKLFDEELGDYLNREFEDYCTCDDYYQPVVEDFELEYYVRGWCKKNQYSN